MPTFIGDIRKELSSDLVKSIEKVVDQNASKHDEYYILVRSDWANRNEIKTTLMLMKEQPPAMIGTLCVYVNNKKGIVEFLSALPDDIPTDHVEMSEEGNKAVFDSAKNNNSPIIYN